MPKIKPLITTALTCAASCMLALCLTACANSSTTASTTSADDDMTDDILDTFLQLTQIPRPSHHEEQISAYLKEWAEDNGFDVIQDAYNNLVIEVPATTGMEEMPKVALQCHMDMVFAEKDGLDLDPLTTTINAVNDGTYLTSDGNTSLG